MRDQELRLLMQQRKNLRDTNSKLRQRIVTLQKRVRELETDRQPPKDDVSKPTDVDMASKRSELNKAAQTLGVDSPEKLPNKKAVLKAIEKARTSPPQEEAESPQEEPEESDTSSSSDDKLDKLLKPTEPSEDEKTDDD